MSHKKIPEFTNIHSCPQSAFAGLNWWITRILESVLSKFDHIIKSNDNFREDVKRNFLPGSEFLHVDAKSFFMSGTNSPTAPLPH